VFTGFRWPKQRYNLGKIGVLGCFMKSRRITALLVLLPLLTILVSAGDSQQAPKISKQTRLELEHLFNAELVYVRTPFPMGKDGLKVKNGVVTPNGSELQQKLAMWGPACKPGDAARISNVVFKDNFIHVEINGGPIKKQKWYEHISVGGADGSSAPLAPSDSTANARGSFVDLYFDNYVPEMTGQDLKQLLRPVLDFEAKSREEAYLETVPPKVKDAIQNHQVLVGMNHEMVTYSKGRPPKKIREHDGEVEYEEWIYGEPPQDVEFVRFIGDEVVRLETMKVDGQKVVKTEKELETEPAPKVAKKDDVRPATAPTLHRAGENPENGPERQNDPGGVVLPPAGQSDPTNPTPGAPPPNFSPAPAR
jgi:hypothetical protein